MYCIASALISEGSKKAGIFLNFPSCFPSPNVGSTSIWHIPYCKHIATVSNFVNMVLVKKLPDLIHWCCGFINFNFEHIFFIFFSVSIVKFELVIVCWAITFFVLKFVMILWNDSHNFQRLHGHRKILHPKIWRILMTILRESILVTACDDIARNISGKPLAEIIRTPLLIMNLKIHFILFIITNIEIMVRTQKIFLKFCKMNY